MVLAERLALDRTPRFSPRRGRVGGIADRCGGTDAAGQTELDLGLSGGVEPGTLPITSSQMVHLWDGLCAAYRVLGLESATKGDNVFRDLVLARIIEPTSKIDAERVLTEVGVDARLVCHGQASPRGYAQPGWRQSLATACAAHAALGPASLVLFDVSTLYFETDTGDGFREPGFSKERGWSRRSPWVCSPTPRVPVDR